jgi:CheY-like chemotaxis protein
MLSEYLRHCGFVIHEAADGLAAIEVAMRVRPAIILMDLVMPRLDGWEATRRLKADPRTSDITIIALSALSLVDERRGARLAGCDDFIAKPCDAVQLADDLRRILDRRSGRDKRGPATVATDKRRDNGAAGPIRDGEITLRALAEAVAADIAFDAAVAASIEQKLKLGRTTGPH